MFKKFIIAVGLPDDSFELMGCVGRLKAYGAQKCLLIQYRTVEEVVDYTRGQSNIPLHKYEEAFKANKQKLIEEGFEVESKVLAGYPASEINRIADAEGYSLIVAGARRRTSSGELYFSSLANDLMHVVSKPLLIMRPKRSGIGEISIDGCEVAKHLLYPTDFSTNADIAFSKILEMAPGRAEKITLLHVQDTVKLSPHLDYKIEEFNRIDTARLEGMKKLIHEKGNIEVDVLVKYGSPAVEILKTVGELGVQLVVMGSQGRGYVEEFFLGSVSGNVARKALSSVLLIPTKH
ncbi:MAG: universal stress protein [Eubacteriales bacterium]|nr:universal stress protein [Eubacteriales bacterium]